MKKYLFLAVISLFLVTGCGEKKEEKKPCEPITGGSYTLNFVITNADLQVESKSVCIACPPDSYEELPVIDGIDGWYYDEALTEKVSGSSTLDVAPLVITPKDQPSCITGYQNITLYAKINENA